MRTVLQRPMFKGLQLVASALQVWLTVIVTVFSMHASYFGLVCSWVMLPRHVQSAANDKNRPHNAH